MVPGPHAVLEAHPDGAAGTQSPEGAVVRPALPSRQPVARAAALAGDHRLHGVDDRAVADTARDGGARQPRPRRTWTDGRLPAVVRVRSLLRVRVLAPRPLDVT